LASVPRVAVLHPGEMGAALGAALVETGAEVVWLPSGRTEATRRRANEAGLNPADDVWDCDVVLSVCPPGNAIDVAESVAGFTGLYVDANAVSPTTAADVAQLVEANGAAYVDGGIIGPPPREPGTTRLYLSGERASEVARLFLDARIDPVVIDGGRFAASTTKMAYASWTKISAALVLAAHETATRLEVDDVLQAEWAISQPELADRLASARRSAAAKGWRWEAEMREIAQTFAAADQPGGFGAAAAEVFARYPQPSRGPREVPERSEDFVG
jgi:3-hydroxyisobutyrate dehydrogenase-like beta-hydroxyacid dehydrogenase